MNKLLPTALLGLFALGMSAPTARADKYFGLCPSGCCGCRCGCCNLCIKPYNAFSPVFSGCMCMGDNCCPPCAPQACAPPCGGGVAMLPGAPIPGMAVAGYPGPGYGLPMMMPMMAYGYGAMPPAYMPAYYPGYYMGNPYMTAYGKPTSPGGQ
jgi:hypothetical protein